MSHTLTLTWRQYRLERRMFWRNPSAAFFNFALPLLLLALFGTVFASNQEDLNVIVPGIAGMVVMSTTFSSLAINLTFLREQGILKRIHGSPLPSSIYLAGLFASAVSNTVIQVTIVIVSGRLFFGLDWPTNWGELVVFLILGVVCFASLGVALSYAIPNFEAAPAYINAVFLPVIFISGVFYDVANVPTVLRDIATILPLKHLIDGLSAAMVHNTPLSDNLAGLAIIAAWMCGGLVLAVKGFSWRSKREV
jgi:ABC-2 type transport system permease protein